MTCEHCQICALYQGLLYCLVAINWVSLVTRQKSCPSCSFYPADLKKWLRNDDTSKLRSHGACENGMVFDFLYGICKTFWSSKMAVKIPNNYSMTTICQTHLDMYKSNLQPYTTMKMLDFAKKNGSFLWILRHVISIRSELRECLSGIGKRRQDQKILWPGRHWKGGKYFYDVKARFLQRQQKPINWCNTSG